jgi:hypothetical protein
LFTLGLTHSRHHTRFEFAKIKMIFNRTLRQTRFCIKDHLLPWIIRFNVKYKTPLSEYIVVCYGLCVVVCVFWFVCYGLCVMVCGDVRVAHLFSIFIYLLLLFFVFFVFCIVLYCLIFVLCLVCPNAALVLFFISSSYIKRF